MSSGNVEREASKDPDVGDFSLGSTMGQTGLK